VIWDVHCHFPRDWQRVDSEEPEKLLDARADALRSAGVTRASLLCGGRLGRSYEESIELARRHEELFVPVAVIDPDDSAGRDVRRLHELGYRGLKIIGPRLAYDDYRYFSVYEAAETLRMPVLLHMGVIGGPVDYSRTHPRRDPEAARTLESTRAVMRRIPRDMSAIRMRPFHLDTIANNFPSLGLIGAHLGGTGNYDEAASVARWRPNVLFDLSGGETIERHAVERRMIGYEIGVEKLVWGSDCTNEAIPEHVARFQRIFADLGLSEADAARIWYWNAAELFGEAEPARAAE
jgi:predicted TIM-barrel fold metal-dependent hydrolase